MKRHLLLFSIVVMALPLNSQDFSEVAAAKGITTGCGSCGVGCGLSFVDFNGDGLDDLTFATESGANILFYENNGNGFTQIIAPVTNTDKNEQIIWVDFDNDGDRDLFVTNFQAPNRLYENDGSFNFTDITAIAGLPVHNDPTYGAVFGDYNNDGWLDLYISNWSFANTYANYLFENDQDGTFTDVTASTGTGDAYNLTFCSAFMDYNNDGYQDLYNSQDRNWSLNTLFENNGDDTFSDVSVPSNSDLAIDAMSVTVGDYDNDGDLDIYVTNTPAQGNNKMLRNNGNETFTEVAVDLGVAFNRVGWGANFFDCENDLDLDLYVCAQHVGASDGNELYINDIVNDTFPEGNPAGMAGDTLNSFSNAIGDFNDDGLPDIAVNNATPPGEAENKFHLWENTSSATNNWIKVRLEGIDSNKEGIGSWIEVYLDGDKYVRYKHCGIGYLAQNSATELIGLGTNATIDTLKVRWLSGNENVLYNVAANQTLDIVENSGPLAVDWLYFEAEQSKPEAISLRWATAFEKENKGFEVRRSTDGFTFQVIGWVDGKGTSLQTTAYTFEDQTIVPGQRYYYRLKQENSDGTFEFSRIIIVETIPNNQTVIGAFYPNPVSRTWTNLDIQTVPSASINIQVYDINGKPVRAILENEASGTTRLSTRHLPVGIYTAKIDINGELYFRKLVVALE